MDNMEMLFTIITYCLYREDVMEDMEELGISSDMLFKLVCWTVEEGIKESKNADENS